MLGHGYDALADSSLVYQSYHGRQRITYHHQQAGTIINNGQTSINHQLTVVINRELTMVILLEENSSERCWAPSLPNLRA